MIFRKVIFFFLIFTFLVFADEQVPDFKKEESIDRLNEELRILREGDVWKEDEANSEIELKSSKDVDVQQKQLKNMVIENRTSDPSSPVAGQIWFRSDL